MILVTGIRSLPSTCRGSLQLGRSGSQDIEGYCRVVDGTGRYPQPRHYSPTPPRDQVAMQIGSGQNITYHKQADRGVALVERSRGLSRLLTFFVVLILEVYKEDMA